MGLLDYIQGQGHEDAYEQVNGAPHKAALSHELIAAAASFEAAKAYEKHVAANGKPPSHEHAKEFLAAAAGAFIDRTVETKGLDEFDVARAKHHARENAQQALIESGEY
ncbi:cipC1 protein [Aspergillus arachidicola]|uniref:CipC1 protein n=1 Tax=Aspergillus arachidicola TaxID=656916 RepID=A0A2G7G334_9EURO|nr:cipC1 protein [Aspergillus arachidicola]